MKTNSELRLTIFAGLAALLALLLATGCGGGGGAKTATISGTVTDINGNPVINAKVSTKDASARTSSTGAYILPKNRADDVLVKAEITQDGIKYFGQNLARTFEGEQTNSVNIVVAPQSQLASIHGNVRDRNGNTLENASVFAYAGVLSSSMAVTDRNGNYRIDGLVAGLNYQLNASGQGFSGDYDQVLLQAGDDAQIDFTLGNSSGGQPASPANLTAVSWTSPADPTRDSEARAYEALKRLYDKNRRSRPLGRTTTNGNPIEIDLQWDASNDDLIGYGIYRAANGGTFSNVDFYHDPLAAYYTDLDQRLVELRTYTYRITALGPDFPDDPGAESDFSNEASVETLDDLGLQPIDLSPLTFRWQGGSGAEEYVVYVFDRFPGVDVPQLWDNSNAPTTGTSLRYTGPGLRSGDTYYYMVLGLANNRNSRTMSQVGQFTAP